MKKTASTLPRHQVIDELRERRASPCSAHVDRDLENTPSSLPAEETRQEERDLRDIGDDHKQQHEREEKRHGFPAELRHRAAGDRAGYEHVRADWRRHYADDDIEHEHDAEMNRIDAVFLDEDHQRNRLHDGSEQEDYDVNDEEDSDPVVRRTQEEIRNRLRDLLDCEDPSQDVEDPEQHVDDGRDDHDFGQERADMSEAQLPIGERQEKAVECRHSGGFSRGHNSSDHAADHP